MDRPLDSSAGDLQCSPDLIDEVIGHVATLKGEVVGQ